MEYPELRDPIEARRFLGQSLWWQRMMPVRASQVANTLEEALIIAAEGEPLPPLGFVADLHHLVFQASVNLHLEALAPPGWPVNLMRTYEDDVLGKLMADSALERASDALRQYQGRDRLLGLSYLVRQMRGAISFHGVLLSPGTLKAALQCDAEEFLREGWDSLLEMGPMPLMIDFYDRLILAMRVSSRVLGTEDLFELEHKTALTHFGQRVALRQVLQASNLLEQTMPPQKPRLTGRRDAVPSQLLEEDTYPVGGFSSITTRGSMESLLHSQLAYMESGERPDLFDIKYVRDELLYYARDENRFLRRRRTLIFALFPDLIHARFKDAELPYQRIVLFLALLHVAVHRLIHWLSSEALHFEFLLIQTQQTNELEAERHLLEVLWMEQLANGTVTIEALPLNRLSQRCIEHSQRSLCHCLLAGTRENLLEVEGIHVTRFVLDGPVPSFAMEDSVLVRPQTDSVWSAWLIALEKLLLHWI